MKKFPIDCDVSCTHFCETQDSPSSGFLYCINSGMSCRKEEMHLIDPAIPCPVERVSVGA